jgi:adenine/guanine phosphoribosyltransferase-like PRPP-binding protein
MNNWRNEIINTDKDNFELGLIWSKNNSLQQIANEIYEIINSDIYDYVACIETKGIIYAAAVCALCGKELKIFRKKDKIIYTEDKYCRQFKNWRNMDDGIEIEKDQIHKNDKIIVIDDIVDTAITLKSIDSIIKECNAEVIKYICIKNISDLHEINDIKIVSLI